MIHLSGNEGKQVKQGGLHFIHSLPFCLKPAKQDVHVVAVVEQALQVLSHAEQLAPKVPT